MVRIVKQKKSFIYKRQSLTDSQITKYEKKYHSPLIFLELYPKPITLKCTPELYAKCMGEEHQHDIQENEHDER